MNIPGADAVEIEIAEGNMDRPDIVSAWTARRGQRTWKPGDPTFDRWHNCPQGPHREPPDSGRSKARRRRWIEIITWGGKAPADRVGTNRARIRGRSVPNSGADRVRMSHGLA